MSELMICEKANDCGVQHCGHGEPHEHMATCGLDCRYSTKEVVCVEVKEDEQEVNQ